ncbi:tetratricopeptide repeat protein [Streptacidiphilus sp. 4-A2]|nr:tetratricopeptide repeat protein [Streptacidiphilus sp. 4-A2]
MSNWPPRRTRPRPPRPGTGPTPGCWTGPSRPVCASTPSTARAAPGRTPTRSRRPRPPPWPRARTWLEEEAPEWLAALRHALDTGRYQQVVDTAEAMHWFSDSLLHWDVWVRVFELSVRAARALGDRQAETVQLNYLAWAHLTCLRRHQQGLDLGREALELARGIGDRRQEGWALLYCGSALRGLGRPEQAYDAYHQAAAVFSPDRSRTGQMGRLVALRAAGNCLRETGQLREAVAAHRQALDDILRTLGSPRSHPTQLMAGFAAHELGLDHAALSEWAEAEQAQRRALGHFEAAGRPDTEVQVLAALGTALAEQGRAEEARDLLRQALGALRDPAADSSRAARQLIREQLSALDGDAPGSDLDGGPERALEPDVRQK